MMKNNITLREWLAQKEFTLALSSSFFGFFAHAGLATALLEEGLLPKKITGSSAGALVGAALASGLSSHELKDLLFGVKKSDFWDPSFGAGLLKGEKFYSLLQKHLVHDFKKTLFPVEAAVFDYVKMKTRFLSTGDLPKAIWASCAVPLMFHPVKIENKFYMDGGVFHKSGINLMDQKERIFCAFFENSGLMGVYERKTSFIGLGSEHKVLRFRDLPKVNPNALESGKLAYAEGYKRMKESLMKIVTAEFLIEATN